MGGAEVKHATVHLGYNDMDFPRSQIVVSKLSVYPEGNTDVAGIIDSMRSNRDNQGALYHYVNCMNRMR